MYLADAHRDLDPGGHADLPAAVAVDRAWAATCGDQSRLWAVHPAARTAPSTGSGPPASWQPNLPTTFVLDDGSVENSIGLNNNVLAFPGIWLNRFTPPGAAYPLTLNQISILFPNATLAGRNLTGLPINLLVYLDTDGNNNPNNAIKIAQLPASVLVADGVTFSNYSVNIPVAGPGDMYIGFSIPFNGGGTNQLSYPPLDPAPRRCGVGASARPPVPILTITTWRMMICAAPLIAWVSPATGPSGRRVTQTSPLAHRLRPAARRPARSP